MNICLYSKIFALCNNSFFCFCRDVQKQKALVKNESLLTVLSGESSPQLISTHIKTSLTDKTAERCSEVHCVARLMC